MRTRRIFSVAPLLVVALAFAVVTAACGSSTTGEPAATGEFKRVVVGDLAIRIPAEWRSYDDNFGPGWEGVSMADPRHEPSDAVKFGFYTQEEPGMTTAQLGRELADSLGADGAAVREQLVFFPSGIPAYEVRARENVDGRTFVVLGYAFARDSSSGTRGYVIMSRAVDAQAGHMAQFRASARSIRLQSAAAPDTTTASGPHASTLTRREKAWVRTLFPLAISIPDAGDEIRAALSDPGAVLVSGSSAHRRMDAALATFQECSPTLRRNGPAPTRRLRPLRGELGAACVRFGRAAVLLARGVDKTDAATLERGYVELSSAIRHFQRATRSLDALLRR